MHDRLLLCQFEADVDGGPPLDWIPVDQVGLESPGLHRIERGLTKKRRSIENLKAEHTALNGDVSIDNDSPCDAGCTGYRRIFRWKPGQEEIPGLFWSKGGVQGRRSAMRRGREIRLFDHI